ncbi:hypothetical protein C9J85_17050 [Haloferax sp. wsp5]|nr:hypothetical protein C9J85_17050 [Haloferax sp. wsp5]
MSDNANAGPRQFDFVATYRNSEDDRRESDTLESGRASTGAPMSSPSRRRTRPSTLAVQHARSDCHQRRRAATDRYRGKTVRRVTDSVSDDQANVAAPPGESEEFTIALSAGANALPKRYPVSFDFQYEMPDGDTEVSQTYRPVSVTDSGGGGSR